MSASTLEIPDNLELNFPNSLIPSIAFSKLEDKKQFVFSVSSKGMEHAHFFKCMHLLNHALNITPDYVNVRAAEINPTAMFATFEHPQQRGTFWNFPNENKNRVLSDDERGARFDGGYEVKNAPIIIDKLIRELHAMGLITSEDFSSARQMLSQSGLEAKVYRGQFTFPDRELIPTHQVNGYGMPSATAKYITSQLPSKPVHAAKPTHGLVP